MRARLAASLALLALLGCEHGSPGPRVEPPRPPPAADAAPPAPPRAQVPRGCEVNLGGVYRLAKRPHWRYQVDDDGEHLTARPLGLADGGAAPMTMVLDRTARGFVGMIAGTASTASGTACPVAFAAEIVACDAAGLTVRSADELQLDEQCRLRPSASAPVERVLWRE